MVISHTRDQETRKIQFSGKSSYMFAIPKKWVEEMQLGAGDEVTVTRQSGTSLLISPSGVFSHKDKAEATIEVFSKNVAGNLVRKLIAMYLMGYNMIHVIPSQGILSSSQRDIVKEVVRRNLVGTEVIADSTKGITIQVLLSFPELSVENALRRMFLISSSMHRDAMLALRKLDQDSARGVIKADDEVDRFSLYLIRQLKMAVQSSRILEEIGLASSRDCLGYRLIIKSVERVADLASKVAQGVLLIKHRLDESLLTAITELSDYALNIFEESGSALFKRDYDAADVVVEKAVSIDDLEKKLLMSLEKGDRIESHQTIRLIVEHVKRMAEYASDIAEIVINLNVEYVVLKER